ncbi:hypothetical protein ACPZJU_19795 [Cereibacter johrii]
MSMLLIDLQAARAVLWVRCRKCRKCLQMSGRSLVREFGPGVMLVDLVRRLRCSKCALPADTAIMLEPSEEASREFMAAEGVSIHAPTFYWTDGRGWHWPED